MLQIVREMAKTFDVESALISGIINAESDFIPGRMNPETPAPGDESYGLMSVKLTTARWLGFAGTADELQKDDKINIYFGTKYLRWLYDHFSTNDLDVIAAYNAGQGNTKKGGPYGNISYVRKVVLCRFLIGMVEDLNVILPLALPVGALMLVDEIRKSIGGKK